MELQYDGYLDTAEELSIFDQRLSGFTDYFPKKKDEQFKNSRSHLDTECSRIAKLVQDVYEDKMALLEMTKNNQLLHAGSEKLTHELNNRSQEIQTLTQSLESSNQLRHQKSETVKKLKGELKTLHEGSSKTEELQQELEKLSHNLGLKLLKRNTSLVLIYTNIDRTNPDRQFLCEVKVVQRTYEVVRTEPKIPDIDVLVKALNETNDLSGFTATLRRRFVGLI